MYFVSLAKITKENSNVEVMMVGLSAVVVVVMLWTVAFMCWLRLVVGLWRGR
jgi:hypothetical protein